MRQLTSKGDEIKMACISKLPMRQLTLIFHCYYNFGFSKLPMRQLTYVDYCQCGSRVSKLPMRQLTSKD